MTRWSLLVALLASGPAALTPIVVEGSALERAPDGRTLVERFECHRCHEGLAVRKAPTAKHCVRCHQAILEGEYEASDEVLARWQERVHSLKAAPSLSAAAQLYRREWIERFLLSPEDLRPHLMATMPRLPLEAAEAAAIARYLVPEDLPDDTELSQAEAERGRALFRELKCDQCHAFSGVAPPPPELTLEMARAYTPVQAVAADLIHTRKRMRPSAVIALIKEPRSVKADAEMPSYQLSERDARALTAFVFTAAPTLPPRARTAPARLPLLQRRVGFDEVSERVLRRVCWHCHSDPDLTDGDGGPGNTGGLGFRGRGLNLANLRGVSSGSVDDMGRRQSIFRLVDGQTPLLLATLLARQAEEAGAPSTELRGMPLGFPALSPEEIQLVESWIAQGRPR